MSVLREFAFNSLPVEMRRRLVRAVHSRDRDQAPVAFVPAKIGNAVLGLAALIFVSALVLLAIFNNGYGKFNDEWLWQNNHIVIFYVLAIGLICYGLLSLTWRIVNHRSLPFDSGFYLFPLSLIDARSTPLRLYDLSQATDISGAHVSKNGGYAGTRFTFKFEKLVAKMLVPSRVEAESVVPELNRRQAAIKEAVAKRDAKTLFAHDPLFELRTGRVSVGSRLIPGEPAAKSVPSFLRYRIFIALFLGIIIGGPLWQMRNQQSDDAAFKEVQASKHEADYKQYLLYGHRHLQEVTDALPRVAFNEAKSAKSVTKLRDVLKRYPNDDLDSDVKAEIHQLYADSLVKFKDQAASADPALVPFIEQLLSSLEASGSSTVQLRFNRPSGDELNKMDGLMAAFAAKRGKVLEPASPWFTSKTDGEREQRITQGLQAGFRVIFPADVLQIVSVTTVNPAQPLMDITYQIDGSGQFYEDINMKTLERTSNRIFVGLICKFDAKVSLPDQPPGWHFSLAVQPPQTFNVDHTKTTTDGQPVQNGFPAPGRVYSVMAERAFDELHSKMRDTLFREGSKAYQQALIRRGS